MKNKKDNDLLFELPYLHFSRSRTVLDSVIENINFTVGAESSQKCFNQFQKMIVLLNENEKKQLKKKVVKNE